ELELRLQHVRGRARIENAPVEIRQLATAPLVELDQLAAPFSVHLLLLKLLGKPFDLRCAIAPQSAKLKVDERVRAGFGVAEILLERGELLASLLGSHLVRA